MGSLTWWDGLEWASAALGLLSVVLLIRRQRIGWWVQNASSLGYVFVFWHGQLRALAGLQWVFIALATWAWWHWPSPSTVAPAKTSAISQQQWLLLILAGLVGTFFIGHFLLTSPESKTPYVEGAVTAFSLVAQWLMGRQQWQTWIFWLAVNLATVGLCLRDQLYATAALYAVFAALAAWGWGSWLRLRKTAR
jgi:nicotinamide mononucleotide transporter